MNLSKTQLIESLFTGDGGPDYTFLYNDAWRPIQGQTKHPSGLGCSCREVWSEIWGFIGPKFDRVMTQGQHAGTLGDQLLVLNRNNYMEESYFAFSFSPIPDDASRLRLR